MKGQENLKKRRNNKEFLASREKKEIPKRRKGRTSFYQAGRLLMFDFP